MWIWMGRKGVFLTATRITPFEASTYITTKVIPKSTTINTNMRITSIRIAVFVPEIYEKDITCFLVTAIRKT